MHQKTIKSKISFKGVTLHSGTISSIKLIPAPANHGIVFSKVDVKSKNKIPANISSVKQAKLCTTIGNNEISISTIEHLMAAIAGYEIDNLLVEVQGDEIPILDGSSKEFSEAIAQTGFEVQSATKKYLNIEKTITVKDGSKFIVAEPTSKKNLEINYTIDFHDNFIKKQSKKIILDQKGFNEIYDSRTFCLQKDLEKIFKMGLARGGSLDNAIVVSNDKVLNQEGLRYKDEFVRHKILDCLGDLYLCGFPIIGKITCYQGGHELTHKLVSNLFSQKKAWSFLNTKNSILPRSKTDTSKNQLVVNL